MWAAWIIAHLALLSVPKNAAFLALISGRRLAKSVTPHTVPDIIKSSIETDPASTPRSAI